MRTSADNGVTADFSTLLPGFWFNLHSFSKSSDTEVWSVDSEQDKTAISNQQDVFPLGPILRISLSAIYASTEDVVTDGLSTIPLIASPVPDIHMPTSEIRRGNAARCARRRIGTVPVCSQAILRPSSQLRWKQSSPV